MGPQDFVNGIQGAASMATPSSYIPEVGNFFSGQFRAGASKAASNALGGWASITADDEEKKRRAAAEDARARAEAMMDPSKYQKVRKDDGGFAFFDPAGKQIDIDSYAKVTGQRRTDVIKDSDNPVDQQFSEDWQQLNDLSQAIYHNDKDTIQEYMDYYPQLFKNGSPKPEDLQKELLKRYPHMFGMGNYDTSKRNLGNPLFRMSDGGGSGGGGGLKL